MESENDESIKAMIYSMCETKLDHRGTTEGIIELIPEIDCKY